MAEVILMQTDPIFNLVLSALKELRDNERLPLARTTFQRAYINRIERAAPPPYTWRKLHDFSRTASVCFRMAMLEATGIPRDWWPETVSTEGNTREGNMHREPDPVRFQLAMTEDDAKRYWSCYDQIYPHYIISERYDNTRADDSVDLNSMMVIFRNDFNEMIEITTTVRLQKDLPSMERREYNASVSVVCIRRVIDPGDDEGTPTFKLLKQVVCAYQDADKKQPKLLEEHKKEVSKLEEGIKKLKI